MCERAGYANGTEGNINCGIYVGVQCGDDDKEEVCAYKIRLTAFNDAEAEKSVKYLPHYITWNKDYINGAVPAGQSRFYYLPINPDTLGDFTILLNKTTPFGHGNGDLNLTGIIHPGGGLRYYERWV